MDMHSEMTMEQTQLKKSQLSPMNYKTSNGCWYDPVSPLGAFDMSSKSQIRLRTKLLVHSLVTLPPENEEAWEMNERSYAAIKRGE